MTYVPDFSGCWGKFDRAEFHREALKGDLGFTSAVEAPAFRDQSNRIPIVAKFNSEKSEYLAEVAELPIGLINWWALIFGDAIHNLRSALDHVVWQLALIPRNGAYPENAREVYFPVSPTPEKFEALPVWRHVPATYKPVLAKYQSYSGEDGWTILRLHQFDIQDKHRLLTPVLLPPSEYESFGFHALGIKVLAVTWLSTSEPLEVGAKVVRISVYVPPEVQAPAEMHSNLTPQVTVAGMGGGHPVEVLDRTSRVVRRILRELT